MKPPASVPDFFSPSDFPDSPTDSAAIQSAVEAAVKAGTLQVRIPCWNPRANAPCWTIDEAIRLPSGMTVVLDNCRLVMADGVFCNMFTNEHAWTPDRNTAAAELSTPPLMAIIAGPSGRFLFHAFAYFSY